MKNKIPKENEMLLTISKKKIVTKCVLLGLNTLGSSGFDGNTFLMLEARLPRLNKTPLIVFACLAVITKYLLFWASIATLAIVLPP